MLSLLFKDTLYTIEQLHIHEDTINVQIVLEGTHRIFEGHFPSNPILPGVVQIEIIRELLQLLKEQEVRLSHMANCKHLSIIDPREHAHISLQIKGYNSQNETINIRASIFSDDRLFTKMSATFSTLHRC